MRPGVKLGDVLSCFEDPVLGPRRAQSRPNEVDGKWLEPCTEAEVKWLEFCKKLNAKEAEME